MEVDAVKQPFERFAGTSKAMEIGNPDLEVERLV